MTIAKTGASHTRTHVQHFTATQQIELFESLKESRFSGQLVISDTQEHTWVIYLYLGRIVYASGGMHPVRRWERHVVAYCPERLAHVNEIQSALASIAQQESRISWEYQLLSLWIDQKKISRDQATKVITASVIEILFDVTQAMEVSYESIRDNLLTTRLILIDAEPVINEASKLYAVWQDAKIADCSPDMVPVIRQPEILRKKTSPQVYQNLSLLIDGNQTLRDLSIRMKRDTITVVHSLLPYIQLGLVQLNEVDDIAPPSSAPVVQKLFKTKTPRRITIACIDDSPMSCEAMEKIIMEAEYNFVKETDGLRAIATLLNRKPDLIFLDSVMPNTNGYEICAQLRKLSFFKNIPIVILTEKNGIVDRMRAKMVGSTDFLGKPAEPAQVLAMINEYVIPEKK